VGLAGFWWFVLLVRVSVLWCGDAVMGLTLWFEFYRFLIVLRSFSCYGYTLCLFVLFCCVFALLVRSVVFNVGGSILCCG